MQHPPGSYDHPSAPSGKYTVVGHRGSTDLHFRRLCSEHLLHHVSGHRVEEEGEEDDEEEEDYHLDYHPLVVTTDDVAD